jgi:hypothetical protein
MEPRTQDPTAPGIDPGASTAPSNAQTDSSNGHRWSDQKHVDEETPSEAFHAAKRSFEELQEYVGYYISAKVDALKVAATNAAIMAVLGIVAGLAGAALVVTAVVYLVRGIAEALTALFGGHAWIGDLVTAIILLGAVVGSLMFVMKKMTHSSRERTLKKYAARQQQQRARFGEDVSQSRGPVE